MSFQFGSCLICRSTGQKRDGPDGLAPWCWMTVELGMGVCAPEAGWSSPAHRAILPLAPGWHNVRGVGLGYMALAGNVSELTGLFSSRNADIYHQVLNSPRDFVRSLLELRSGHTNGPRASALHEIFVGGPCTSHKAHEYGYAMEAVCFALCESLGEVGGSYGSIHDAESALEAAGGSAALVPQMDVKWFLPAPFPAMEDWPMVYVCDSHECSRRAVALKQVLEGFGSMTAGPIAHEFLIAFQIWYASCATSGCDLIVVAH